MSVLFNNVARLLLPFFPLSAAVDANYTRHCWLAIGLTVLKAIICVTKAGLFTSITIGLEIFARKDELLL